MRTGIGEELKPFDDGLIKLMCMLIAPIIFTMVAARLAGRGDLKIIGRVGRRAIIYFEVVTTLTLAIGLLVVNGIALAAVIHATAASLDVKAMAHYAIEARDGHGGFLRISSRAFLWVLLPRGTW